MFSRYAAAEIHRIMKLYELLTTALLQPTSSCTLPQKVYFVSDCDGAGRRFRYSLVFVHACEMHSKVFRKLIFGLATSTVRLLAVRSAL